MSDTRITDQREYLKGRSLEQVYALYRGCSAQEQKIVQGYSPHAIVGVDDDGEAVTAKEQLRRLRVGIKKIILDLLRRAKEDHRLEDHLRVFHHGLHTTYTDIRIPEEYCVLVLKSAPAKSEEAQQITREWDVYRHLVHPVWYMANTLDRIVQSVDLFKHEGRLYYATRRKPLHNLEETVAKGGTVSEAICKALDTLALFHATMTHGIDEHYETNFISGSARMGITIPTGGNNMVGVSFVPYQYFDEFMIRTIVGRPHDAYPRFALPGEAHFQRGKAPRFLQENRPLERLVYEYQQFASIFTRSSAPKVVVHGDALPRNFLEDGTILDFERVTIAEPLLDCPMLLTPLHADDLREHYYDRLDAYTCGYKNKQLDRMFYEHCWGDLDFDFLYACNQAHFLFCYTGTLLRDNHLDAATAMVAMLWETLNAPRKRAWQQQKFHQLRDAFGEYIFSPQSPHPELKNALS